MTIGQNQNTILKRDLNTGAITIWYDRPGSDLSVLTASRDTSVIFAREVQSNSYYVVTAPNTATKMDLMFTSESRPDVRGFVVDANGIWVGSRDGMYLWNARTGGVRVSAVQGIPAGTCA